MATKTNSGSTETGVQVIARAGEILRLLAQSDQGTSLRMLAVATGLPRSTVHRIVVALASEHLVVWDPERGVADLGLGLVSLALARRQRLRDAVRPHLESYWCGARTRQRTWPSCAATLRSSSTR